MINGYEKINKDRCRIMDNYDIKCKVIEEALRSVWPEWHVACRLGGGTFGDVFRIYRDNYGRRMESALKVIQLSSGETTGGNDIPDALQREIDIMEALRGAPNIVIIEDFSYRRVGQTSTLFVRMELLNCLQEVLSGRKGQGPLLSIREIIKLGKDVCRALMYCEKKGIIHRDIKPANLFVDRFGDYKVGDFGASKRMDMLQNTQTMTSIGTISYMAPEIFQGRSYNHTVDIYALGLVLYQLMNNGRMPFLPEEGTYTTQDIDSANYQRLHGAPIPSLTGKTVGGEMIDSCLDAVVRKACAMYAANRYQTAEEFYNALAFAEMAEKNSTSSFAQRSPGNSESTADLPKHRQKTVKSGTGIQSQESGIRSPEFGIRSSESGISPYGVPGTDMPPQSYAEEKEERSGGNKLVPVIAILFIVAAAAIAVLLGNRVFSRPSASTDSNVAMQVEEKGEIGLEEDNPPDQTGSDTEATDITSEAGHRDPGSISDSWGEIIDSVKDGTYFDKYKIGDTKELDLGEEGVIMMELVAFDTDELADGSGKAAMTWIAKDLLNTVHVMNAELTSEGGWPASDLRAWMQESVLPLFPEEVRSNIKEVMKYSYSYSDSQTISSSDKIWIPGRREVFGEEVSQELEGPEYLNVFPDDASRIRKHIDASEPICWWIRSAAGNYDANFDFVDTEGTGTYVSDAWAEYGVVVGFCF